MRSFVLALAMTAISLAFSSCKGADSPVAPTNPADSSASNPLADQAPNIDGTTYSTPFFSGNIQKSGRVVGSDTLGLTVLDFFIYGRSGLEFVGKLNLVGPQRGTYLLDSMNNPRWSQVHMDHYRPGIDSCNYTSKSGTVTVDSWVDTTVSGKTGKAVTGSVRGTLVQVIKGAETCPESLPVAFGFRNVFLLDVPQ